ncbi:MAG: HAMP domain-containing histidine kinase [Clostridium sp.]|nr:HAMP domain-containing histidine kinase [Clostridium sp.]
MLTMMTLLSITFISIIIAINVWIRAGSRMEADNHLRSLTQREMRPEFPGSAPDNTPDHHMEPATTHFILVKYSPGGQLISIENSLSDSYSDEEIQSYCNQVLQMDKPQGTIGQLRFSLLTNNDGQIIAFIDHTAQLRNGRNLLMISVILGIVGLIAFSFLSYVLSGLMVRPVEEAFEKQKQFISDASHELKTPIAVILSNSELLEDQIGKNCQLSYIQQECDQMHNLVNSLLMLTRLEQTPYENMEKNTFCLSDALLEQILPLESIAFEKGITITENITPNISFFGVKQQLQQVVTILVDNAFSHTAKKGNIDISLFQTQHHIRLTVSNTGEVIPEDEREKLFERFYRTDKARNRANGHYGLGLSIAKTIITNHKGKIHVECADGVTSFIVTL